VYTLVHEVECSAQPHVSTTQPAHWLSVEYARTPTYINAILARNQKLRYINVYSYLSASAVLPNTIAQPLMLSSVQSTLD
jgi:hypothetical protein